MNTRFLSDLREGGTPGVTDFAHGAARCRSIESALTAA